MNMDTSRQTPFKNKTSKTAFNRYNRGFILLGGSQGIVAWVKILCIQLKNAAFLKNLWPKSDRDVFNYTVYTDQADYTELYLF